MSAIVSRLGVSGRLFLLMAIGLVGAFAVQKAATVMFSHDVLESRAVGVASKTDLAVSVIAYYHGLADAGQMSEAQAQMLALKAVERLRYEGENYFWINTMDMTVLMHGADPDLNGQNLADLQDPDGVYLWREMVSSVENAQYGRIAHTWPKPGAAPDAPPADKLTVVQRFAPWDWVVGTSIFLDDIAEAEARIERNLLKIFAVIAVVMWLSATGLAFSVTGPLKRLTRRMTDLSKGDTESEVPFGDEKTIFGEISRALTVFRSALIEQEALRKRTAEKEAADHARELREAEQLRARELAEQRALQEAEETKRRAQEEARRVSEQAEEAARLEREAHARDQQQIVATLADAMNRFAGGDLSVHISAPFPDAYEGLRTNFNRTVANLSQVMAEVANSGEMVDSSSSEISVAATEMAKRTEQVSVAIEGTSAAVTELTSAAKMATTSASGANALMQRTLQNADDSREVTKRAVSSMQKINESSNAISKVVDLIESIAFQTNLLALNAGVEAARAGENGRGFAVVAMEVRALAQRSSDAVQEINGFILDSRADVEAGLKEVSAAGQAIEDVISQIAEASGRMGEIMQTVTEQSAALSDIECSVSDIDRAMQQNAAAFEETASVGIALSNAARRLNDLIKGFELQQDRALAGAAVRVA